MHNKRILLFWAVMLSSVVVVMAGFLEMVAYVLIAQKGKTFYLPAPLKNIETMVIPEETRTNFSASLGWEHRHPNKEGYRGDPKDITNAALAVFGDSYTQGHPDIEKSWPHLLEQKLASPVLNFGIGGYGTDQAYLRFEERYAEKLDTPYVGLFIMPENIARVVSHYRGFYVRRNRVSYTKPMFHHDGQTIELLPNPLTSPDDFKKLGDMAFLQEIGAKDYWFKSFGNYGLNEFAGFPYSYYLLKSLPYYTKRSYDRWVKYEYPYVALYQDERALEILDHVIDQFVARAVEQGAVPIVGFLPQLVNMLRYQESGEAVYHDFLRDLKSRADFVVVDMLDFFAPYLDRGEDPLAFFISANDGHYNGRGEAVVSDALFGVLRDMDADRNLIGLGGKDTAQAIP